MIDVLLLAAVVVVPTAVAIVLGAGTSAEHRSSLYLHATAGVFEDRVAMQPIHLAMPAIAQPDAATAVSGPLPTLPRSRRRFGLGSSLDRVRKPVIAPPVQMPAGRLVNLSDEPLAQPVGA